MPDEFITMLDPQGKQVKIPRQRWLDEILPQGLERSWDDPEALYAQLWSALNENAGLAVLDAIHHLAEIDAGPERASVLESVALIQGGKMDEAEALLRAYIEQHGPTAAVLTNLAKIQHERGERAQGEITLRKALAIDANLESTLGWYLNLQHQHGGAAAAEGALRQLAEQPENWRARLWIATRLLKQKQEPEATAAYRQMLAGAPLPADAIVQITGDLGRAGMVRQMIELVLPVYQIQSHGPVAGMNLLQGLIQLRLIQEADELLRALQDLNHPMLTEMLATFSVRLEAAKELAATEPGANQQMPEEDPQGVQVMGVPLLNPVWTAMLNNPEWMLPPLKEGAIKVAVFSLADLTRPPEAKGGDAPAPQSGAASVVARSLPLYLAETLRLRSDAATLCILPIVPKVGPATIGTPWPLPHMMAACPKEFQPDYVVCGALTRGSRGAKVELHVFRCRDKEPLKTIRVPANEDFGGTAAAAAAALLACLGAEGVKAQENPAMAPVVGADTYAGCLGHVLVQTLAANNLIEPRRLPPVAALLDTYFKMADQEAQSPLPTLLAISGLAATIRYDPRAAAVYKQPLLDLIARQSGQHPMLEKLSPVILKFLGETDQSAAAIESARQSADPAYIKWLDSLSALNERPRVS